MRWTKAAAFFFALCVGSNYVAASFTKDVISGSSDERRRVLRRKELHNIILKYAQPLSGHPQESKLRASFGDSSRTLPSFMARRLDEEDDAINFDIAEYSLKFSKCQTIKSYSDDAVEEGYEDVLVAQNFVVFRLCPTQSCSSSSNLGCKQDYGEYIMMLADYLEIMNEYLENRKEAYCDFCADCFDNDDEERRRLKNHRRKLEEADQDEDQDEDENNEEADDEQADDDEEDNDDNADNDDGGDNDEDDDEEDNDDENDDGDNDGEGDDDEQNEDEEDDDANDDEDDENDDDEENDDEEDDEEDDDQDEDDYVAAGDDNVNGDDGNNYCNVCGDYDTYAAKCEDEDRDDDYGNAAVEYADWFECTQIDIDDGLERYGMATCAEDTGYAIAIKLFSDQYCTEVVGDTATANEYSGINFENDGMVDYYFEECITCNATALNADYQDPNEEGQDEDEDGINDLCENIYQDSAQCDSTMNNYDDDAYSGNDGDVCIFISNVLNGSYDSEGEIYISSSSKNNKSSVFEEVSSDQKIILGVFVFLTIALGIWSIVLHDSIYAKIPWKPRRKEKGENLLNDSDDFSREGSYQGTMA